MKAADLLIRCLEAEGVEYMFGVPGEENADVMIALLDSSIRFIVCRHEQAAAFMADGYGRLTGRAACCLGTLGPGASNLLTGVGNANMDRSPLVVITGQAATTRMHKESHQAMDLVGLFRPVVKWGASVAHPDAIPEIVRKAFRTATTDKYGACHIDLPENIAKMQTLSRPIIPLEVQRSSPNDKAVARAAELIRAAQFPIIMAGNGIFRNNATAELRTFALQNGIPVVNTFMGKGVFSPASPQFLFTIGLGARDYPAAAMERADCVITVGFDMVEYHPYLWNRGNKKAIVHVDGSPSEIDDNYRTAVEVVGDIGLSLSALTLATQGMAGPPPSVYAPFREAMTAHLHAHDDDTGFPVKPQRVLADVRRALSQRDIILSDVGAHKMWIARYLHTEDPNTILISNGFCSMGFALPAAIGAKLACPDRRVLAICGDGGVMMNIQDLETAVREKIAIVVMVWTDSEYGLIKWKQTNEFGKHSHISFTNPDWMKLADAFGMAGFQAKQASDIPNILSQAFEAGRPALIEVPIDYRENVKLTLALKEIPFEKLCDSLSHIDIFKGVPENFRRKIAEEMTEAEIPKGTAVFREGDPGNALYVIHKGRAVVTQGGRDLAVMGPGDEFGEMAVVSSAARSATVVAQEDMLVSRLDGELFRNLVRAEPEIGLHLARVLAERLKQKNAAD